MAGDTKLTEKNYVLPFINKNKDQKENLSYPGELACVACLAELQRKKTGFLRDTPEKLAAISRVYYPFWIVSSEAACILLDSQGLMSHKFTFKEPTKTGAFIEDLKKNSTSQQEFMSALSSQAEKIKEFTSPVNMSFKSVVADRELLEFFSESLKNNSLLTETNFEENSAIPLEINAEGAAETSLAVANCFRTMRADAKGLQYALGVLKEEAEFHKLMATREIESLKEKCEAETTSLRPLVDKAVKKLTMKHDKTLATVLKNNERKTSALEKKREGYMRKLQQAEQRKDAVQKRINNAKRRSTSGKSAYGSYELDKTNREIENIKKQIKTTSEDLDRAKKEGDNKAKQVEQEFHNAVTAEEEKITALNTACEAKVSDKKKQIGVITTESATVTSNFETFMNDLKRDTDALRQQIEIDWKMNVSEDAALLYVPIYLIKYMKEKSARYSLFSPMSISEETGVLNGLRKILTLSSDPKLKTLARPTNKRLQEILTLNVVEKMQNDELLQSKIETLSRASNLMDRMEFAETLNQGLDEIVRRGWMNSEEASASCKRIMEDKT